VLQVHSVMCDIQYFTRGRRKAALASGVSSQAIAILDNNPYTGRTVARIGKKCAAKIENAQY